jgi:hypothetical protein
MRSALLLLSLAVAACGATNTPTASEARPASPPGEAAAPAEDGCGVSKLTAYRNALPTSDVLAAIRKIVGERPLRVINPGDAVTMDYSPSRLNIETGEDGRIKTFRCG